MSRSSARACGSSVATRNEGMRRYVRLEQRAPRRREHPPRPARRVAPRPPERHDAAARPARLGGYRDFDGPEDYDLWLRARRAGCVSRSSEALAPLARRLGAPHALAPALCSRAVPDAQGPFPSRWTPRPPPCGGLGAGPLGKALGRAWLRNGGRLVAWADVAPRRIGRRILDAPVLSASEAVRVVGALHLGAVGRPGARAPLRQLASELGLVEGADFFVVA